MTTEFRAPPIDLALWKVMGHVYFASGSSAPADIRGLARWLHPIGVSIPALSERALVEIEYLTHGHTPVFVDTGAFSEVAMKGGRPVVVAPISDTSWEERIAVELRLTRALGPAAYCVAPDCVGDQTETLRRMSRFAREMGEVRALGGRVVVPLQRGAMSTAAFDAACSSALGFDDYVRGIPGNKDAMPLVELESFLRAARPPAIHVLGMGPRSTTFHAFCDTMRRLGRGVAISYDSNLIAAHVGRANGRAGAPRALTALQAALAGDSGDKAREDAVAMLVGPSMLMARAALAGLVGLREAAPALPSLFDAFADTAPVTSSKDRTP